MTIRTWQFTAADSLFFGGGKPMNAGESYWIDSQFPPTGLTLQGAIRTAVLYYTGADIDAFVNGNACLPNGGGSLKDEIGDAKSLGRLKLTGPFLYHNGELLFPAPLDLISNRHGQRALLKPADTAAECDLGRIRLPAVKGAGYKVTENSYVSHHDMAKLLNGEADGVEQIPLIAENATEKGLADKEPKMGLARNNRTRNSVEGMLFSIAPVRPRPGVGLSLRVQGIEPEHLPQQAFLQKLGGEGKLAGIRVSDKDISMPEARRITQQGETVRFKLVFTQPALMPVNGWLPKSFAQAANKEYWFGPLNDCEVTIISACIGKPLKLGGWDLKTGSSKTHKAYIPAGSVYFCEAQAKDRESILKLHNTKLGDNCEYGFGHVLVGCW
ncbi:MAG: type III-B CRISPR module-associated protein Cmr3 [Methylobacter sp.]